MCAGLQLHLSSLRRTTPEALAKGPEFEGNVIVDSSAKIGKDCKIGPNVSIGIGCEIENGVRIANAVLLHRVKACLLPSCLVIVVHCGSSVLVLVVDMCLGAAELCQVVSSLQASG
jgi:mannose-1-phosphate guanylyltransferase